MTATTKHLTLTNDEIVSVAQFWHDWFDKAGHDIEPPSAFQVEALNDPEITNAFLFWTASGDVHTDPDVTPPRVRLMFESLGTPQTDSAKVEEALQRVFVTLPTGPDMVDTGTVFVLALCLQDIKNDKLEDAWTHLVDAVRLNEALYGDEPPFHTMVMGTILAAIRVFLMVSDPEKRGRAIKVFLTGKPE